VSTEFLSVLVGGPGLVALVVAIVGFLQNRRTLSASQPKTEAEKMQIDIENLRSLLEETRLAREADKLDFQYRIAELKAQLAEQAKAHERAINDLLRKIAAYLEEHAISKPHWWPRRNQDKGMESDAGD
jgi:hypothetical protein